MRIWRKHGVTEQAVLNMQRMCNHETDPDKNEECHVAEGYHTRIAPRFLIQNGDVFLTHLNPKGTGPGHPVSHGAPRARGARCACRP